VKTLKETLKETRERRKEGRKEERTMAMEICVVGLIVSGVVVRRRMAKKS
jgi:hypothetical protein